MSVGELVQQRVSGSYLDDAYDNAITVFQKLGADADASLPQYADVCTALRSRQPWLEARRSQGADDTFVIAPRISSRGFDALVQSVDSSIYVDDTFRRAGLRAEPSHINTSNKYAWSRTHNKGYCGIQAGIVLDGRVPFEFEPDMQPVTAGQFIMLHAVRLNFGSESYRDTEEVVCFRQYRPILTRNAPTWAIGFRRFGRLGLGVSGTDDAPSMYVLPVKAPSAQLVRQR